MPPLLTFNAPEPATIPEIIMNSILIEYDFIGINGQVYVANSTTDCTRPANGWYFTVELAEGNNVMYIEDGIILQIESCEENTTTTTSTTTLIPTTTYCYSGVYTSPDPIHPLGGVVTYINNLGISVSVTGIWDTDEVFIDAVSITSTTGVYPCGVPTTTTTTTTVFAPIYSIQLIPKCRYNNCNDNAACSVDYDIVTDSAPLGSYYGLVINFATGATASLPDNTAVSGIFRYSETSGFGSVNFTLTLYSSVGWPLSNVTLTMNHQSFWSYLPIC